MQLKFLTVFFSLLTLGIYGQEAKRISFYEHKITLAKTDADKINALGELAEYYSIFNAESKADSLLQKAIFIAEVSHDKALALKILFNSTITNLYPWSSEQTFDKCISIIQKGMQNAQDSRRDDYVALAHIRLAGIYRKRHQHNTAIQEATLAFSSLGESGADSLRCVLYIELGDIYMSNADAVPAYKNFNNAFSIAYNQKHFRLQSEIYHRYSELYKSIGDNDAGKRFLLQSLQLNEKHHDLEGELKDYLDLARITNEREYIDKAGELAEKLNSDFYKLATSKLLYYWYMVIGKNSDQTFQYLDKNPDLIRFFKNTGAANYHYQVANIYRYGNNFDSAIRYFRLAEAELDSSYDAGFRLSIIYSTAETLLLNKDSSASKPYFEKSIILGTQINQVSVLPVICNQLAMLSARQADYRKAYEYAIIADSAHRVIEANASKDKVVLLQVDQENKRRESDFKEAVMKKERKHNLQLMAITVMLTGIFALMLFIGMFSVSKTTIKMLGYFAFISLFEFIILVLEHPIHVLTHGEPIKIWLIKILLIAILVPCQHFLEHRLIGFLQSRKLLEARQRISLRNWWSRIKKPSPLINDDFDDTAVL